MTPLKQKFDKLTSNEFDYIRLSVVNFELYKRTAQYVFIYPQDKDTYVKESKGLIEGHLKTILASAFDTTIVFQIAHFDRHLFLSNLFEYLKKMPSIVNFVKPKDIDIDSVGNDIKLVININDTVYDYVMSNDIVSKIKKHLHYIYTQNFDITVKAVQSSPDELQRQHTRLDNKGAVAATTLDDVDTGRAIVPLNIRTLFGNPIQSSARYITDSRVPLDNIVLCGTLSSWDELTAKSTGKKFYKFVLQDFTDSIGGVIFVTQKNADSVAKLKQGDTIIVKGNIELDTYTGGGAVSFKPRDVSYCDLPKDFKLNRIISVVPQNYSVVFPQSYKDSQQSQFLQEDDVYLHQDIREGQFVVFDLETTGLDERQNTIIEIAAVKIVKGKLTETFETMIDPKVKLTYNITELTGITDDMLKGKPLLHTVIPDFFKFCDGTTLVAHNLEFDERFLQHYAKTQNIHFDNPKMDTLKLARQKVKGLKNYKLGTLCQKFDIVNPSAHRALHDAVATAKLFLKLYQM